MRCKPQHSNSCLQRALLTDNIRYVFGGSTNSTFDTTATKDDGYLDVYILSLPSFTWFAAGALSEVRRANHFCQVIGQGQMLVIGGRDPSIQNSDTLYFWDGADPWTRGMNIFDMTSLTWTADYSPTVTYERPAMVQKHYANHANNATWSDPALAALFVPKPPSPTSSSAPSSSAPFSAPSTSATHHRHHHNLGAIIGGIVAGVAALLIIAVLALCLVRHRQRRRRERQPIPDWQESHEMPHEQKYEMESHFPTAGPVELPATEADGAYMIKRKPI